MEKTRASHRHFKQEKGHFEINEIPSMTVQGQSFTIDEVMTRYTQGTPLTPKDVEYLDSTFDQEENFVHPDIDIIDVHERAQNLKKIKTFIDEKIQEKKAMEEP